MLFMRSVLLEPCIGPHTPTHRHVIHEQPCVVLPTRWQTRLPSSSCNFTGLAATVAFLPHPIPLPLGEGAVRSPS
jgi:hypothetical protein